MRKLTVVLLVIAALTAFASTALAGPFGPITYMSTRTHYGAFGPIIYSTTPLLPCDRIGRALDGLTCYAPMGPYGPIVYGARYGGGSPGIW